MQPIILASNSPARCRLLEQLGLAFTCISPNIDETPHAKETAENLVLRLASDKASAIGKQFNSHLIIAADQVCLLNNTITGKPHSIENACTQLSHASGKKVTFFTGLAVLNTKMGRITSVCEQYHVYFRKLRSEEIEFYVNTELPLQCAGSFKSEGLGITLFTKLEGSDPNTLIGLPLITLTTILMNEGMNPLLGNNPIV